MKTHWLFGMGPNKEVKFNIEVDVETDCKKCIHREVCDLAMPKRCGNYEWSSSDAQNPNSCHSCIHKYTRWHKDSLPCFTCKFFSPDPKVSA